MHITFQPEQILYHGTIDIYAQVIEKFGIDIIRRKNGGVDFGPGFYVTVGKKEQAIGWAKNKALNPTYSKDALEKIGMTFADFSSIKDKVFPVIISYKIKEPEAWLELRHKVFISNDANWKRFVWLGRQLTDPLEEYDWIFGPVADGGVYGRTSNGIIALDGYNQLAVHNKEIASMLELLEVKSC